MNRRREMSSKRYQVSESSGSDSDEVSEIKRAMREARARKKSLASKMKMQWEKDNTERSEMEDILRNTTHELEQTKKKLANCEFELREAKYDTNQHIHKYQKIEEEKKHAEVVFQSKLTEMQLKQDMMIRIHEERYHTIALECDKVCTLLEGFVHTAEECKRRENVSKTMRHILGKTISCLERVKIIATHPHLPLSEIKTKPHPSVKDVLNVDATVDAAMLEMCKSLEEENNILAETVQSLKAELNETKREAAASQLIPHYRLAILRSRTYATNLMEQVQREQATSQALREQLDETYQDLKKVVEDKRKLYKKLSKSTLISEEQEYMKHFTEKQQQHSRHDQQQYTEDKTHHHHHVVSSSSSGGHNREQHGTSHVMRALSSTVQDVDMHLQQAELEEGLKMELKVLDDQIDMLKDKLGKAALLQSQKILTDVIDSSLAMFPPGSTL